MPGIAFVTEITLEPHASIGLHRHDHDAELYLIVAGHAEALLDDERRPVGPGDAFICPPGHSHGIDNGDEPLRFLALLTEARSGGDT
jgi:quercetin dioxygenase-like cupin family protein